MPQSLSLEDPAFVESAKTRWRGQLPLRMTVLEYHGTGDPAFGGRADDRALGLDGLILPPHSTKQRAIFNTIEEAHQAAKAIKNRRPDSILGVLPLWREPQ